MNPQNTGSFASAIGGMSPELLAAMQSRQGQGGGATSAVSPSAPGFDPATNSPTTPMGAQQMPQGGMPLPTSQAVTDPSQGAVPPQFPFDPAEVSMIVGALSNRLKSISEMGKASLGVHPAQQPQGGM